MSANGNTDADADEGWRLRHLLRGARDVDTIIPALARAAEANFDAGRALEGVSLKLTQIGTDTARAVSDTVELKRHLKAITDREQVLRAELDAIKLQLAPKRRQPRKIKHKKNHQPSRRRLDASKSGRRR